MRGLPAVLFCITLAIAQVACGQDKGKPTTAKKATTTTLAQNKEPTQKKAPAKAQKKATTEKKATTDKKAPTQAQKKQQDRMGDCNKQANLKNMKGEDRKTFVNKCLSS